MAKAKKFKRGKSLTKGFLKLEEGVSYPIQILSEPKELDGVGFKVIEVKTLEDEKELMLPYYKSFEPFEVGKLYEIIFVEKGETREGKPFNIYQIYELLEEE